MYFLHTLLLALKNWGKKCTKYASKYRIYIYYKYNHFRHCWVQLHFYMFLSHLIWYWVKNAQSLQREDPRSECMRIDKGIMLSTKNCFWEECERYNTVSGALRIIFIRKDNRHTCIRYSVYKIRWYEHNWSTENSPSTKLFWEFW